MTERILKLLRFGRRNSNGDKNDDDHQGDVEEVIVEKYGSFRNIPLISFVCLNPLLFHLRVFCHFLYPT